MRVRVVGASGVIAGFLIPRLVASGAQVIAHTRAQEPPTALRGLPVDWRTGQTAEVLAITEDCEALVWLGPLNLFGEGAACNALRGTGHCIAFSSTSALTKQASPSAGERRLAALIVDSEEAAKGACASAGAALTLLRPTLIYGAGRDANLSAIASLIDRFGVMLLPAAANGLRQPVHADDLALACIQALAHACARGRTYELPGATTLSYRTMVEAVFAALGKPARVLTVPAPLLRLAVALMARHRGRDWDPAMIGRMGIDLVFDAGPAQRDFGYAPRPFRIDAGMLGRCR